MADSISDGRNERGAERAGFGGGPAPLGASEPDEREREPELADAPHERDVRWDRELQSDEEAGRTRNDNGSGASIYDGREWWEAEPPIRRVVDGLAFRVDRLRCTGNGVVPLQAAQAWQRIKGLAEEI